MTKNVFLSLVLILALALLTACDEGADYEEDFYEDEESALYEDAGNDEDFSDEYDDEYVEETDDEGNFLDGIFGDYVETPEDCYEDEYFDPVDQLCYIQEDCEGDECADLGDDFYTLLDEIAGGFMSGEQDFTHFDEAGDNAIITYDVANNRISNPQLGAVTDDLLPYQEDSAKHQEIWVYFANLIPAQNRSYLSKFIIFTDGEEEIFASVAPDPEDPTQWVLSMDIVDAENPKELTYTIIHEYAHLLTLNNQQVPANEELFFDPDNEDLYYEAVNACDTYFPGEGCSLATSYINQFYDQFWADIYDDWLEMTGDDPDNEEGLEAFYDEYEDRFVTDYAATNVGEDIAESFTAFVLQPKPAGDTIAEEKILFFYNYPELIQLRTAITSRTYSRLRR